MRELLFVLLCVVVVGALESLFYLMRYLRDRRTDEVRKRLQSLSTLQSDAARGLLRQTYLAHSPWLHTFLLTFSPAVHLAGLIEQSGVSLTVAQVIGFAFSLAGIGCLGALALGGDLIVMAGFVLFAGAVPFLAILYLRKKRSSKMSEQLPDALEMMSRALRAGHAIPSSFEFVATQMPEPINIEFARAYEEQRLGVTLEKAVVDMTLRVPNNGNLKIFAVSVNVERQTGGNLAEILDTIAETIRARFRFYGKLGALTAEGRMSGLVLASLPILMLIFLHISNPTYINVLYENRLGNFILAYAATSWLVGLVWMHSMTKVEI